MVRVIDSFLYNGEPIVKYRLRLLAPVVDEFLVVESKYTHSGKEKPFLWCEKHADVFAPYSDKVKFVKLDEFPPMPEEWKSRSYAAFMKNATDWWRENYQRDVIAGHVEKTDEFILICTDADEIPNPAMFADRQQLYDAITEPLYLEMQFFYYNFKWIKQERWYHGYLVNDKCITKDTLSNLRCYHPKRRIVRNGGWHCGYFFSIADLQRKLESFAHQEFNSDVYKNQEHLRECLRTGKDLFLRKNEDMKEHTMTDLPPGWEEVQTEIASMQDVVSSS